MSLSGHLWTISTRLRRRSLPPEAPTWSARVRDPKVGKVQLTGQLRVPAGAKDLVLLVHGLGGCSESGYMHHQERKVIGHGMACLRLNLRGADRRGEDFYHAGLVEDLEAALASPQLEAFERIYLWGNSLGGHTVLRWSLAPSDPRVRAVTAVCSPLDLAASSRVFEAFSKKPYLRYVLQALKEIYAAVAARRPVPLAAAEAARIGTLVEWDEKIVSPRHDFAGAADYYLRTSVGPRLAELRLPALYVGSEGDPMVPPSSVRRSLATACGKVESRWSRRGGHMAFPRDLDLGLAPGPGLEEQILGWLRER